VVGVGFVRGGVPIFEQAASERAAAIMAATAKGRDMMVFLFLASVLFAPEDDYAAQSLPDARLSMA
jgi:hypothetical protein